ncbi:PREDICTED: cornulin-like [Gavialis gangeticus]|uniref:cornulin-like n=1 Tax=Gavialis gangeticus TaxID=94835 RepID=UPI00092FAB15|nr:PREDICTED: cornulin-like [Gavialis gangeticus]
MTQLQGNIEGIISAFNAYAKKDGGCITLSKGELRQLIQQEFADVLVKPHDLQTIDQVLQRLDAESEDRIDFDEFLVLVFQVAKACHKELNPCQPSGDGQSSASQGDASRGQAQKAEHDPGHHHVQEPQAPKQGQKQPEAPEQDPSRPQAPETPTAEGDLSHRHIQDPEVSQGDGSREAQATETPEHDSICRQGQEPEQDPSHHRTQKQDPNREGQAPQVPQQDVKHEALEPGAPEQAPNRHPVLQPSVSERDLDHCQSSASERGLDRHPALQPSTSETDLDRHQGLESEAPEQDLSPTAERESTHYEAHEPQAPEQESQESQPAEQDQNRHQSEEPETSEHTLCHQPQEAQPTEQDLTRETQTPRVPEGDVSRGGTPFSPALQQDRGAQQDPREEALTAYRPYIYQCQKPPTFPYQWLPK